MTTRPASTFSPPPLLHTRSSPSVNQQFPTLRPPLQTTPTRDGRSRSTNQVNGSSTPSKSESMTYDTFYDVLSQRIDDPLYSDQLARLNRITTSLSHQLSTLDSSAKQYADLDSQQKELLGIIRESRETLERESRGRLTTAIPEIAEQNKTMENIERRVDAARSKLAEESDLLAEIDFKIAQNRRLLSLPPPSSRNHISAPPLPSKEHSRENSRDPSLERTETYSTDFPDSESGWKCIIS